jgi:hypothetical protein
MKFIITESKREKAVFYWLDKRFGDVEPYESDNYPNDIFFIKNGEVIFEFGGFSNSLTIKNDKIWEFVETFFGLNYFQTQDITTRWINDKFNLNSKRSHEGGDRPKWRKIENEINNL